MARPCAEMRRALGIYVVGAIAPAERDALERHLATCAECRDELAGLAGLPALLSRVPAEEVDRLSLDDSGAERAPQPPLQALARRAAQLRRHRLWPALAAAAAAGLIIGGAAVAASSLRGDPPDQPAAAAQQWVPAVSGSDPRTGTGAVVRYAARPWGTQLEVQVRGIGAGTRCELQVINVAGQDVPSGSWTVVGGHLHAWYPASSAVPSAAIRGFVIMSGNRHLVTIPVSLAR
jgi:Putative zinc-finger